MRDPNLPQQMGLEEMGPDTFDDEPETAAIAMYERDSLFRDDMHQDYEGVNPYEEDGHGAWLEEQGEFYDGLGGESPDLEGETEQMIEQDKTMAGRSEDYQSGVREQNKGGQF